MVPIVSGRCHENLDQASNDDYDDTNFDENHGNPYPGEGYVSQVGCGV